MSEVERPAGMFDREWEWDRLMAFASDPAPGATLGVVTGRRRQGKSYLLQELCAATGGFYFAATEATAAESLRLLGEAVARHRGLPAPLSLGGWEQAIDALLALPGDRPAPVVVDELPYLWHAAPQLPSVVQAALGPRRAERLRSQARLVLCGSALSVMGGLLSGSSPLRGRAGLELVVQPFDYRSAARFWGASDPWLALRLHAVVGGTPAYRRELVRGDAPSGPSDFDDWVVRAVLDPASPLFREARYLLAEEPDLRDVSLYHSILGAVAEGHTTRRAIATAAGRKDDTLRHPITVLQDAGLLAREEDAFRRGRSTYRIIEPLVAFYYAVMRPQWARLEHPGRGRQVWEEAQQRYRSNVLGPHFELLCRTWAAQFAAPATFGGVAASVGAGVVHDSATRHGHQVDVVVRDSAGTVLAVGESKAGRAMDVDDLRRLQRVRELLQSDRRAGEPPIKLVCFAPRFSPELRRVRTATDVVLVDLDRLYSGD